MNSFEEPFQDVEDRIERLISRRLDGELDSAGQAELDAILSRDESARVFLDASLAVDRLAAQAIRADFATTRSPAPTRLSYRGWWIGAVGGVLAAAAVLAFSFMTSLPSAAPSGTAGPPLAHHAAPSSPLPPTHLVDYRYNDFFQRDRQTNLQRDVIGIRGPDQNKIYILERAKQSTRLRPIGGDI